jgi:hypothetical protein
VDEILVAALGCGASWEVAAATARVSKQTVYRRMQNLEFRQRVAAFTANLVERSSRMLVAGLTGAIQTLLTLQTKEGTPAAVQLGAAKACVELALRMKEATDWETRLRDLEARLAAGGRDERDGWPERIGGNGRAC